MYENPQRIELVDLETKEVENISMMLPTLFYNLVARSSIRDYSEVNFR